jgi:PBP1b-binding outer membrane lipoprotein LpoB
MPSARMWSGARSGRGDGGRTPARLAWLLAAVLVPLSGCATTYPVVNAPGRPTTYEDPGTRGAVSGVGIESQDIVGMTDRMVRDMLGSKVLAGRSSPPRVIIDAEYFRNESSSPLNKNSITDRMRVGLNRSVQGRMVFVGRQYADMVARERDLKRQGAVDTGTTTLTKAQLGGDYRLGGRIVSLDQRSPSTGLMSRYNQITFEMVDLETGEIVWSGIYEFLKTAQDDVIYR